MNPFRHDAWLRTKLSRAPAWIAYRGIPLTAAGRQMRSNGDRLAELRNKHKGRRCFVVGTGPSLSIEDLNRIKGEISISCNKIYLAFGETDWRPDYLAVIDEMVAQNNREALRLLKVPRLYSWQAFTHLMPDPGALVVKSLPHPQDQDGHESLGFSDDLLKGVHGGYTVLYFAMQAAAFMGMKDVILLGTDFSFNQSPSTGNFNRHDGEILKSAGERNHFHADYRKPGELWTRPRLDDQRLAFVKARNYFERCGGKLLNASRSTKLDVIERIELDNCF